MARQVATINHTVLAFIVIGLSTVPLVSSVGRNESVSVEETVNYTLSYYSIDDYVLNYDYSFDISAVGQSVRNNRNIRFFYIQSMKWLFKLTCWFTFQCPIECQCILAETHITVTCPDRISVVEVEYPSGEWSTYRISHAGNDEESSITYAPITIYFWVDNGLSNITQGAFNYLRHIRDCYLIISLNYIGDIQERQFERLSKLRGLFLDNNEIVTIRQNAFEGLDTLVFLYLYQNDIVNILPNLFQRLNELKLLDIGYNNIVKIHAHGFHGLTNVRWLFLDYNRISEIHQLQFQDLTKLLELHLNRNRIPEIHPLQFQNLNKLTELNLGHNRISKIHPFLFQNLTNLMYLYLHQNMISEIHPLQFQNLHILILLNLNRNMISEVHPLQFQNLTILSHLHLSRNLINKIHPQLFQTCSLYWLNLRHNMISEIHPLQFQNYSHLYWLNLGHNMISKIHPLQFQNVTNLLRLYINYNKISKFHPLQFHNLNKLVHLFLDHNNISDIPPNFFPERIIDLDLSYNKISKIPHAFMKNMSGLKNLYLQNNRISEIHPFLFQIVWLDISHNEITEISLNQSLNELKFLNLGYNNLVKFTLASTAKFRLLKYLSLSNNKLRVLEYTMFKHMLSLRVLDLSSNHIKMINSVSLVNHSIAPIELIDLRQNNIFVLSPETFSEFYNATIWVDDEATCCFITINCTAVFPRSQFLTCGRLLPNMLQRASIWILGLFALMCNLGVLVYKYHNKGKENKVQLVLIFNLSISDMIMGIYMIIISSADLYYKGRFQSELWRLSFPCKFAGTLSVLSSEASVFFVTLISVDRFIGIRYTFSTYRIDTRKSKILSLVLWLIAILISIVSTILTSVNPDWYDVSEVCTGLPLSRKNVYATAHNITWNFVDRDDIQLDNLPGSWIKSVTGDQPGMYFGIAIFTALNFLCFLVMCVCYTGIFVTSIQTAKKAGRARDSKQERKMAIRMGAIVISDLACWAPIIILSILVQSGRHVVTPHVYTWIVTFVLPINSAINPFLYTFAALIFDFIDKRNKNKTKPW